MHELPDTSRKRFAILIGIGIVVASICNGAVTYLKRTGVVDHASYQAYWSIHCNGKAELASWTVTAACPCGETPDAPDPTREQLSIEEASFSYLYSSNGYELALKLVKDILAAAFILLSLYPVGRRDRRFPELNSCWPLVVLSAVVLFGFANSYANHGGVVALAGLRPYLFLAIAMTGCWVAGDLGILARCVALLLGIELLLMPFELAFGMHVHGHFGDSNFVRRLSGTLVSPNSFGIFVAAALAFYHAFSNSARVSGTLIAIAIVLVAASGSGTAWLALLLVLLAIFVAKFRNPHPAAVAIVAIALCAILLFALPALVGRTEVFDSVFGPGARLDEVTSVIRSSGKLELLLGKGIGVATNTGATLFGARGPMPQFALPTNSYSGAESTVVALIKQTGLVGLLAFYTVLAWAFWRDRRARLFYVVIALSSLTAKITELFPVNFLLGLALAHSIRGPAPAPGIPATDGGPRK